MNYAHIRGYDEMELCMYETLMGICLLVMECDEMNTCEVLMGKNNESRLHVSGRDIVFK